MELKQVLGALSALSHENRLAIYRLLVERGPEGFTPGAIADELQLAPATLSFHLKELSAAGLVLSRQEGRNIWYRADFGAMTEVIQYLTENCCCRSDACATSCAPSTSSTPKASRRSAPTRRSR